MKTGDPKQAVLLGIVALGAVGFLGSTLFSTFASGSTASPAPAAQDAAKPAEPATEQSAPTVQKLPENEPSDNDSELEGSELPPKIETTPFGKPAPVKAPKPKDGKKAPAPMGGKRTGSGADSGTPPFDPTAEKPEILPDSGEMPPGGLGAGADGAADPTDKGKAKPIMIRFEGYVDAGNPVAIVRIGNSQYTADQGEGLPYGIRVIAMTSEKLTLSIRGRRKSIWIGREVQL